jgi:hypothetical protein
MMGFFLFATASKLSLEHTQLPIRWILGALPPVVKRPGHEADHLPPTCAEVKNATSSIRLHGVVSN